MISMNVRVGHAAATHDRSRDAKRRSKNNDYYYDDDDDEHVLLAGAGRHTQLAACTMCFADLARDTVHLREDLKRQQQHDRGVPVFVRSRVREDVSRALQRALLAGAQAACGLRSEKDDHTKARAHLRDAEQALRDDAFVRPEDLPPPRNVRDDAAAGTDGLPHRHTLRQIAYATLSRLCATLLAAVAAVRGHVRTQQRRFAAEERTTNARADAAAAALLAKRISPETRAAVSRALVGARDTLATHGRGEADAMLAWERTAERGDPTGYLRLHAYATRNALAQRADHDLLARVQKAYVDLEKARTAYKAARAQRHAAFRARLADLVRTVCEKHIQTAFHQITAQGKHEAHDILTAYQTQRETHHGDNDDDDDDDARRHFCEHVRDTTWARHVTRGMRTWMKQQRWLR